jgi:hypothetical protein
MKLKSLIALILALSTTTPAHADLCRSIETIAKNEPVIAALDPQKNVESLDFYRQTQAAYTEIYTAMLISAYTDSMRSFAGDVRSCPKGDRNLFLKSMSPQDMASAFTPKQLAKLNDLILPNGAMAETKIHIVSWTIAFAGGVGIIIGIASGGELFVIPMLGVGAMVSGESTSGITWLLNRSPSFVRRIYLQHFDDKDLQLVQTVGNILGAKKMNSIMYPVATSAATNLR